jgi:hypothetical protein
VEEHTSARGVLRLKDVGVKSRALLGGWNAWVSGGGPVATGPPR